LTVGNGSARGCQPPPAPANARDASPHGCDAAALPAVRIIEAMKKELHPVHENIACEVCGRTILKGERTEAFLAPGGRRHTVCDLCFARAEQLGWLREAAAGDAAQHRLPRPEPRRPLLGRLFRGRPRRPAASNGTPTEPEHEPVAPAEDSGLAGEPDPSAWREASPPPAEQLPRSRPKEPRRVHAVPTTADVKIERALEVFNASVHQRTIGGLVRTLGQPWATAVPDPAAPSMVNVIVAWELSWYWFQVDLGDETEPIALLEKGDELGQIDEGLRAWNASVDGDGRLVAGVGSPEA
jgi:hypothetical protein